MQTGTPTISSTKKIALVSVVITTYNHSIYLPDSIESVLAQTWPAIELLIVDDGSGDNTAAVVARYPQAKYTYQKNKGLSAARNTGALISKGKYILFLDADDMLYPGAISTLLTFFDQYPACGFISGGHDIMTNEKIIISSEEWQHFPQKDHYQALLRCDYISMHGAVMYNRDVFIRYRYDETLYSCEDYDFYLQIAKNYPVVSHNIKLSAYRKHEKSMSGNVLLMYRSAMKVIHKHENAQSSPQIKNCCRIGKRDIRSHYAELLLSDLTKGKYLRQCCTKDLLLVPSLLRWKDILFLGKYSLKLLLNLFGKYFFALVRRAVRISKGGSQNIVPRPGHIWIKDLNRTIPFNKNLGAARGGSIEQYYISCFLSDYRECIKGNVLEFGKAKYAQPFGGEGIKSSKIIVGNNSDAPFAIIYESGVPANDLPEQFDCILLIQFLNRIYDYNAALAFCFRALKKGGVLLLTVPGISTSAYDNRRGNTSYWSFTGRVIHKLLGKLFNPIDLQVKTYGNVLTASSLLYGIGKSELTEQELLQTDPNYQVVVAAKAIKN